MSLRGHIGTQLSEHLVRAIIRQVRLPMTASNKPETKDIFQEIIKDFPDIHFVRGSNFFWSPDNKTITYTSMGTHSDLSHLLHEIGHAKLNHAYYSSDAELVNMEYAAWEYASDELAPKYKIQLTTEDEIVNNALDSYRQWLHERSVCPSCQAIGLESSPGEYKCLVCQSVWRVNEARSCRLRRYKQ